MTPLTSSEPAYPYFVMDGVDWLRRVGRVSTPPDRSQWALAGKRWLHDTTPDPFLEVAQRHPRTVES
jgi:hypothetical protein